MKKLSKPAFRQEIINQIEQNFKDSVVFWTGTGSPDEMDQDNYTENFEALWISDVDYERFLTFEWHLVLILAKPMGYEIMVQCLSPEATKKYRWEEYKKKREV